MFEGAELNAAMINNPRKANTDRTVKLLLFELLCLSCSFLCSSDANRWRLVVQRSSLSKGFDRLSLDPHQLLDALLCQLQQIIHLFACEGRAFRGALNFYESAIA